MKKYSTQILLLIIAGLLIALGVCASSDDEVKVEVADVIDMKVSADLAESTDEDVEEDTEEGDEEEGDMKMGASIKDSITFGNDKKTMIVELSRSLKACGADGEKCMQAKVGGEWDFYHGNIEGFEYELGKYYKLKVEDNDGKWKLVEILVKA